MFDYVSLAKWCANVLLALWQMPLVELDGVQLLLACPRQSLL
jgi:hypothetical protein